MHLICLEGISWAFALSDSKFSKLRVGRDGAATVPVTYICCDGGFLIKIGPARSDSLSASRL